MNGGKEMKVLAISDGHYEAIDSIGVKVIERWGVR